jgi:uncharacterized protein (DUF2237 family)
MLITMRGRSRVCLYTCVRYSRSHRQQEPRCWLKNIKTNTHKELCAHESKAAGKALVAPPVMYAKSSHCTHTITVDVCVHVFIFARSVVFGAEPPKERFREGM